MKCLTIGHIQTIVHPKHNAYFCCLYPLRLIVQHNTLKRLLHAQSIEDFDFRVFDDIDAVFDSPIPEFAEELMQAYPNHMVILTVVPRHHRHHEEGCKMHGDTEQEQQEGTLKRVLMYGTQCPSRVQAQKRYIRNNAHLISITDPKRLLVIDMTSDNKWEQLCNFLQVEIPDVPFPHVKDK